MAVERRKAKRTLKCFSCEEQVRRDEAYFQTTLEGVDLKGEHYCPSCEDVAHENDEEFYDSADDDLERGLRLREEYASYHAAGATQHFFDDLEAGYIDN